MKLPIIVELEKPTLWFGDRWKGFSFFIWTIVYIKGMSDYVKAKLINHENIHFRQQVELGFIFFYILWGIFWLINAIIRKNGYIYNPLEEEAYDNDGNLEYLKTRKWYAWIKYIGKVHRINFD